VGVFAPNLTVTADDFGIGVETSRGIVDCFRSGAIDATSVMTVTGTRLERSLPLLEGVGGLRLGLHLTLTSPAGRPLVATRATGLVARGGTFRGLGELYQLCSLGRVDRGGVRDEILAQVERFRRVLESAPGHVDAHHHAHQLPVVREVVAELVAGGQLPAVVRSTVEPAETWAVAGDRVRRGAIRHLGVRARPMLLAAGAKLTDGFCGVLSKSMLGRADPWSAYREALPGGGRWEMMVHPGYLDGELEGRDTYRGSRVVELTALLRLGARKAPAAM